MATIISVSSDRVLEFTTSETLLRKIKIDENATEVRVVMLPFVTASAGSGTEQYSPAVTKETLRFGFTDGNTLVSGSNYTISGVGVKSGDTSNITLFDNSNSTKLFQNVRSIWDFNDLPVSQSNSGGDGAGASQFGIKASDAFASIYGYRIWKSGSLDLYSEFRNQNSFGSVPSLPVSDSTISGYCNNFTSVMGGPQRRDKFTFNTESDRDTAFSRLNTVCWSWPFVNYNARVASIAYKVIY